MISTAAHTLATRYSAVVGMTRPIKWVLGPVGTLEFVLVDDENVAQLRRLDGTLVRTGALTSVSRPVVVGRFLVQDGRQRAPVVVGLLVHARRRDGRAQRGGTSRRRAQRRRRERRRDEERRGRHEPHGASH